MAHFDITNTRNYYIMNIESYSTWARQNRGLTRIIVFIIQMAVLLNGLFLGALLFLNDAVIPTWLTWTVASLGGLCLIAYPTRSKFLPILKNTFWNRKKMDFSLILVAYLLVTCCSISFINRDSVDATSFSEAKAEFVVLKPSVKEGEKLFDLSKFMIVKEYRKLKKRYKTELRALKKELKANKSSDSDSKTGVMVLLIILSVLVALGLAFLGVILACSAFCSGSDVLGVLIVIFTAVGIPVLLFMTIRKIVRKYRVETEIIYK